MSIWNLEAIEENMGIDTALENEIEEMASQHVYEGTMDEADMMIYESAADMYKCEAALYIADTFIERKVVTEGVDAAEILVENVITDAAKNVAEKIKHLWSQVKAWFASVIKKIQDTIGIGAGFVNKHRDALKKVNVAEVLKNKEIVAFPYTTASLASAQNKVHAMYEGSKKLMSSDVVNKTFSVIAKGGDKQAYESSEALAAEIGDIAALDKNEFTNKLFELAKITKATSLGDVKHGIILVGRGGQQQPTKLTNVDVNDLISIVDNYKNTVKSIKEEQKKADAIFKDAVNLFDGIQKKAANGDKLTSKFGSVMSRMQTNVHVVLHMNQAASSALVSVNRDAYNSTLSVLRALLSGEKKGAKKADKEEKKEATKENALLESIMASL